MARNEYYDSFLIDSVECLSYLLKYEVLDDREEDYTVNTTAEFTFSIDDAVDLSVGKSVTISRGTVTATDDTLFIGIVNKVSVDVDRYVVEFQSRLQAYNYKRVNKSYDINIDTEAGVYSAIFKDIVEEGGLNCTVVDSGTDIVVQRFLCSNETRRNRMDRIRDILNWQYRDDFNNNYVKLEPIGFSSYSTKLVVGENIKSLPIWEEDLEPMRNDITVKGATAEDTIVQRFSGDGATTTFTLSATPEITNCVVDGTQQTQGIEGVSTSFDYTVDKELKTFTFESGSIPASGTNNVVMTYTTKLLRPVRGKEYSSISKYEITKEDIYEFKDVSTIEDAETRLQQLLTYIGNAFVSTSFLTYPTADLHSGLTVDIEDFRNPDRNGQYVVLSVKFRYPDPKDEVKIASTDFSLEKVFRSIDARLEELEKGTVKEIGFLNQIFNLENITQAQERYFAIYKLDISVDDPNTLYWESTEQGTWNDFNWSDGNAGTGTLTMLQQGNNTYQELVRDSEFYDSANSSGTTWNTTTNTISISAGAMQTEYLFTGISYSYITINLGTTTGTITLEYQLDGGSWTSITAGTRTVIAGGSSGIKIRATSAGAATITNTTDNNGTISNPAISVLVE